MSDSPPPPAIHVRTLLGSAQLPLALRCLSSLAQTSAEPVRFIIHEDGSLKDEDAAMLREKLPVHSIVSRQEADDVVLPLLRNCPECLDYRKASPLALKLFDVALMEASPLYFCDSDVLFLLPHTGLFHGILTSGIQGVFMRDSRESYALRPWSVWPLRPQRLLSRINTGLTALAPGAFDLDFIQFFLKKNGTSRSFQRRPGWVEQTCWAALAARLETRLYHPRQIAIACPALTQIKDPPMAIHFVSSYRGMIDSYPGTRLAPQSPPQRIRLVKASMAHVHKLVLAEAAAQWRRRFGG